MCADQKAGGKHRGFIAATKVKPHQAAWLDVGIYESAMPQPSLHLEYEPDVRDSIGAGLIRRDLDGEYMLRYELQNFGDVACIVSIWECEDDGAEDQV